LLEAQTVSPATKPGADRGTDARGTLSFWQPKKRLLSWRALCGGLQDSGQPAMPAQSLAIARVRNRIAAEGKRNGRLSEH